MSAVLDSVFPQLAKDLLAEFGADRTLTRVTETYDPTIGTTTKTTATHTVTLSPPEDVTARADMRVLLGGGESLVRAGDMVALMAAEGAPVQPDVLPTLADDETVNDYVDVDGFRWNVVYAAPIYSGAKVAAITLVLRRGGRIT